MGPAVSRSDWARRPVRIAMISAQIEIAVSSGVRAPTSRPIGDWIRAISSSDTPASRSRKIRPSCVRRDPIAPRYPTRVFTAAAIAQQPVKLGVLNDQTGLYADLTGMGSVHAARMAVEDYGGKVLGRPIASFSKALMSVASL